MGEQPVGTVTQRSWQKPGVAVCRMGTPGEATAFLAGRLGTWETGYLGDWVPGRLGP
jgi:hypothetical protein